MKKHLTYIIILLIFSVLQITGAAKNLQKDHLKKDNVYREDTRSAEGIRIGKKSGLIRYLYSKTQNAPHSDPQEAVSEFLKINGHAFGITDHEEALHFHGSQRSSAGNHFIYTQKIEQIPVYNSDLVLSLNERNEVVFVASNIRLKIKPASMIASISVSEALRIAREYIRIQGKYFADPEIELMIFPGKSEGAVLAYRVRIATNNPRGDWELFVHAQSGNVVNIRNRIMYDGYVNGKGAVFDPDPLTVSGTYYGIEYNDPDGNDFDSDALNAQRILVELPDITQQDDNYILSGPYVRLVDMESPNDIFPVLSHPDSFIYTRGQQEFEDVMAYYHIDKSYRYLKSLVGDDILGLVGFKVDPHGANGEDNSYYIGGSANFCSFGEGGVDDAEDAAVLWHEYAHAIQENIVQPSGMTYQGETKSLQEGSSDYWAASYNRTTSEFGWQHVFLWDAGITSFNGPGEFWAGRRCDTDLKYPDDYDYTPDNEHLNGQIWSSALMHIQDDLGREITDKIFIQAHYLWGSSPGLEDAAHAFIQADSLLYNGIHTSIIVPWFTHHGLVQANEYLAKILHDTLNDTEDVNGPYTVKVTILPGPVELDTSQLWLRYGYDSLFVDSVKLVADANQNEYYAQIPGPGGISADIQYYFTVMDSAGGYVISPWRAPLNFYSFYAGPDTIPPNIIHTPLIDQSLARWPAEIRVQSTDNLSVDNVLIRYYINDTVDPDSFYLDHQFDNLYSKEFPIQLSQINVGDSLFYQIIVEDASAQGNRAYLPLDNWFNFEISEGGGKIVMNFEEDTSGYVVSGDWQWGVPESGPGSAFSGEKLWGTVLNDNYTEGPVSSSLILPEIDLTGFEHVKLQFWHWYDIEVGFDGGNLKISDDDGGNWSLITPLEGYDVVIDTGYGNPLKGETAFSGQSPGWRTVSYNLDNYSDKMIRIRFDFGSDMTKSAAGWFIDSLIIFDQEAILKAPIKLKVVDNRSIIKLEWDSPFMKNIAKKIDEKHIEKDAKIDSGRDIITGLPSYYIYKSIDGSDFLFLDNTLESTYIDSLVYSGYEYSYFLTTYNGEMESAASDTVTTIVEPVTDISSGEMIPDSYKLFQNYPNPFNPSTVINWQLAVGSHVELTVYNLLGKKVITLVSKQMNPGNHSHRFDGSSLASGIYYYEIIAGDYRELKKMVLLK